MRLKTVAVVFNPTGGSAKQEGLKSLHAALAGYDIEVLDMPTTADPNSASELASQASLQNVDLVIAYGGDGTVSGCAEGLIKAGKDTPLAVFPGGTGNMLAKSFYSNLSPSEFVNMIRSGQRTKLDVISAQYKPTANENHSKEKIAVVALSLGWLSDVLVDTKSKHKRHFGMGAYIWRMLKASALAHKQTHHNVSVLSGRTNNYKTSVAFALNIAPPLASLVSRGCNASDGLLDFVVIDATTALDLLKLGVMFLLGKVDRSQFYHSVRRKAVIVTSETPFMLEIDGDKVELTSYLKLTALPQALSCILF
jgi:diacylglycerol kinase family enzyme